MCGDQRRAREVNLDERPCLKKMSCRAVGQRQLIGNHLTCRVTTDFTHLGNVEKNQHSCALNVKSARQCSGFGTRDMKLTQQRKTQQARQFSLTIGPGFGENRFQLYANRIGFYRQCFGNGVDRKAFGDQGCNPGFGR